MSGIMRLIDFAPGHTMIYQRRKEGRKGGGVAIIGARVGARPGTL